MPQPAAAIPPYDPESLQTLVGGWCYIPKLAWGSFVADIVGVDLIDDDHALLKVCAPGHSSKWVPISECRWIGHLDDPLLKAMHKARASVQPTTP